jgi:hypothetical protein
MQNQTKSLSKSFWIALIALVGSCGCGTRVVYVPYGEPVRLAESVKARVWVKGADGVSVRSSNRITLAEGWYALPKD